MCIKDFQEFDKVTVMTENFALFTDVSVSPGFKLGVGAYVMIPASLLKASSRDMGRPEIAARLKVRRFEGASSTRLELQTVLWALAEIGPDISHENLTIYTDSQCVSGLLRRKSRLMSVGLGVLPVFHQKSDLRF